MSDSDIPPSSNGMRDSHKKTDLPARSQEQRSNKSSSQNTKPKEVSSSINFNLTVGDPLRYREEAGNNLIRAAEETSGTGMSEESKKVIQKYMQNASMGFLGVIPMKCRGQNCPFISSCPLALAGVALPIGHSCPVEQNMIVIWVNKHLKALGIEDVFSPESSFDMDLLYELAGQELIRWRCGVHLSDDPSLVTRELVNSTVTGVDIFSDVINPVLDVLERAGRNINKIREALVATREAQVKAGQEAKDPSQKAAELRQKALEVLKQKREYLSRLQSPEHIKDAEIVRVKRETEELENNT